MGPAEIPGQQHSQEEDSGEDFEPRDAAKALTVEASPTSKTCVAQKEECNGADDDCDGEVDEEMGMQVCGEGACQVEVVACQSGALVNCTPGEPSDEACNNTDDDCDGEVDEDSIEPGTTCDTGALGICAAGTERCVDGTVTCVANLGSTAESCNGLDDDCNGVVDDGGLDPGTACSSGGAGICAAGTSRCVDGQVQCVANQTPVDEACNGKDDDCDGTVDDGNPGGGASCTTGKNGICAAGTTTCSSGSIGCVQTTQAAADEICDNDKDDDCNGMVDDGCCAPGLQDCNNVGGCECIGTACCGSGCQSAHQNGLGGYFFDCEPLGTHTLTQAAAACLAHTGDISQCFNLGAACDSGTTSAVCSSGNMECACWTYAGTNPGRVFLNGGNTSCLCPLATDPTWN